MRDWSDAKESFDAIVVDPPAFAKTRRAVEGALRGYKELNLRALKMLRGEEDDEGDQGDLAAQFNRQLKRIRNGEPIGTLKVPFCKRS